MMRVKMSPRSHAVRVNAMGELHDSPRILVQSL